MRGDHGAVDRPVDAAALLGDLLPRPARVLDRWSGRVPELAALRGCPQPSNHHAEGDVWAHTHLALEVFADLPATVERWAGPTLAAAGVAPDFPAPTATQALAVLLHDAAKPRCMAGPEGDWTYHGHDREGAALVTALAARLDLPGAARTAGMALDVPRAAWLVREHLFWLTADPARVGDTAVARRFAHADGRGEDLRVLTWCDTLGSRGPDGRPYVALAVAGEVRLEAARRRWAAAAARPPRVVDGREVMAALGISSGPRVGAILGWVAGRSGDARTALQLLDGNRDWLRTAPTAMITAAARGGETAGRSRGT